MLEPLIRTISITILGVPQPKQSARFRIAKSKAGKNFIMSYQKKEVKETASNIKFDIINQLPSDFKPFTGAVHINRLYYVFPFTSVMAKNKTTMGLFERGHTLWKTTKPDTDNLQKTLWDSFEGIVFINDSQICSLDGVTKVYGDKPRIEVEITGEYL